jgi:hypothetical protein
MDIEEFFAANETIERDPVRRLNARVEQLCARILPADLPPDVRAAIEGSRLSALHTRAKDAIERGRTDLIDSILAEFASDLGRALDFERRPGGRLYIGLQADEAKRVAATGYFEKYLINGFEVRALADGLEPGEKIDIHTPAFRVIKTNRREIARGSDFFDRGRPAGYSKEFWLKKCTPADRLAEAENAAKREETEAARPLWNDSPAAGAGPHVAPR